MNAVIRLVVALLSFAHRDATSSHTDAAAQAAAAQSALSQLEAASGTTRQPRRITAN
jgi:hypothetical protein